MRAYTYVVPWLLSYFAVNCAPTEGELKYPGIGVELEVRSFKLQNDREVAKKTRDDNVIASVKGATLIFVDDPKTPAADKKVGLTCGQHWDLTAEHSGGEPGTGISELTWEWIIDGVGLKMKKTDKPGDDLVLPAVWKEIRDNLNKMKPKKGDQFLIHKVPSDPWGAWTLIAPDQYVEGAVFPGIQVTTGLPMEAIQEHISIIATGEDLNGDEKLTFVFMPPTTKKSNFVLVTKEDLKDVYDSPDEIENDTLGFYSLLMSYVKLAAKMSEADRDNGPKQKLSLMPRTDWKTLYNTYAKEDDNKRKTKCAKKKNPNQTLLDIAKDLAKKKDLGNIETATFKWQKKSIPPPLPTRPSPRSSSCKNVAARSLLFTRDGFSKRAGVDTNVNWPTKQEDQNKRDLSVKTWLEELDKNVDPLSVMDKLVWDGQIGGFGDRIEAPLYPREGVTGYPLFEIRDLSGGSMNLVENFLISAETQVKQWHKDPPASKEQKRRKRALGKACKKPSNDKECTGKQAPNAQGKCEDCPKDMKPNALHTQCVKDKCTGNTTPNALKQGACEPCPKGTKPNVGNTLCVPDGPDDDKKRGKCKDEGYILDPAQGGQDEKTENPVCTLDDSKKCENKSWTAVTRSPKNVVTPKDAKSYQAECAKDEDPNFRCKDSKTTYHHKESVSKDNGDEKVIKHSCRATRNTKKEQKDKYQKRVDVAKEQKTRTTTSKQTEKKENNRRGRMGMCFAVLVGMGAFDLAEIDAMTPDEVDGMMEMWPGADMDPRFLDDHMLTIGYKPTGVAVGGIDMETAGRALPSAWIIKGIVKLFKIFSKPARAAPPSTRKAFYTETKNAGARPKAPPKAVNAAKSSGTVGKILKDQRFLDCLAAAPAIAAKVGRAKRAEPPKQIDVNEFRIAIDWNAPRNGYKIPGEQYEDRVITVKLGDNTDNVFGEGGATDWASTYPDRINRPGRLVYEDCQAIPDNLKNKVTAVETWGGCCGFYADNDCKESSFMFAMTDREDWKLDGQHNDNMEAVWCTFEANCKGAPGAK